jgi:phage tail sheath protein FI
MLVAALPLPHVDTSRIVGVGNVVHAQADMLAYLQRIGVLRPDGSVGSSGLASAFVQLSWPWLRTQASNDLPEGLESPDGILAGLIAGNAAQRGTFRSVAGDFSMARLRDVADAEPIPAWGQGDDSPSGQLARHICLIAQSPDGWALQSDVTTAGDESWRFGGASRLMSSIVRTARALGDSAAFEPNGPRLWARLRGSLEDMLMEYWYEGAFAGATAAQAFSVVCDSTTMTQNDIDAGRLIVQISVQPAVSIERITVVLNLGNTATSSALKEIA